MVREAQYCSSDLSVSPDDVLKGHKGSDEMVQRRRQQAFSWRAGPLQLRQCQGEARGTHRLKLSSCVGFILHQTESGDANVHFRESDGVLIPWLGHIFLFLRLQSLCHYCSQKKVSARVCSTSQQPKTLVLGSRSVSYCVPFVLFGRKTAVMWLLNILPFGQGAMASTVSLLSMHMTPTPHRQNGSSG